MRVRLLTHLSLAQVHQPGDVLDLAEAHAQALLRLGVAEPEDGQPAVSSPPEAAALAMPPEQAIVPRARRRG